MTRGRSGRGAATSRCSTRRRSPWARIPSQPCEGDSGGPAFVTSGGVESIVGIVSHGDAECVGGAVFTRVDAYASDFILPTIAAYADGTGSAGQPCVFPARCVGGAAACVTAPDDANVTYCTEGCSENADCPAGMVCVSEGNAGFQCRYLTPTPGALGASCTSDASCVDGVCDPAGTCSLTCAPGVVACPGSLECDDIGPPGNPEFYCVAVPLTVTGGACAVSASSGGSAAVTLAAVVAAALAGRRRVRRPADTMRA